MPSKEDLLETVFSGGGTGDVSDDLGEDQLSVVCLRALENRLT